MAKKDILIFGNKPIIGSSTNSTSIQIAKQLSKENRVLYIEGQPNYVRRARKGFHIGNKQPQYETINENLSVYRLVKVPLFPNSYPNMIRRFNMLINCMYLNRVMRNSSFRPSIFFNFVWFAAELQEMLRIPTKIYYCVDSPSLYTIAESTKKHILMNELNTIYNSDITLCVSETLKESLSKYKPTYYIPNAINPNIYSINNNIQSLYTGKKKDGIKIGILGGLDRCDRSLIKAISENENWSTYFIGPYSDNDCVEFPNVKFTGPIPYEEVPKRINDLDVGLVPYQVNERTNSIFPIKAIEYLACGVPVVSTNLSAIRWINDNNGNLIYVANDTEDFIFKIKLAVTEDNGRIRNERIEVSKQHTWEQRVKSIMKIIGDF